MPDPTMAAPDACIVGWAHTPFGRSDAPDIETLLAQVGRAAIEDAGISPADIDAGFVGVFGEGFTNQGFPSSLILQSVPELRSAMLEEFGVSIGLLAEMIGERAGKPADDLGVRTLAGAIIGVVLSVTVAYWSSPSTEALLEISHLVDEALEPLRLYDRSVREPVTASRCVRCEALGHRLWRCRRLGRQPLA